MGEEKLNWNSLLQSIDLSSHANDTPEITSSSNSISGAHLGKIRNTVKLYDKLLEEIGKKPLSKEQFINRIAGSLGYNNKDSAKSKYPDEEFIVGNGASVTIRTSGHYANADNYTRAYNTRFNPNKNVV